MQIETLKVFCDLVDTASFSRAASLNSITQSAVSQQVRSLEQKYHVSLIERGKKNFSVTQEGQAFLQASREILHTFENLGDRIRELQNVVTGELRIATIYSFGLHELPPLLERYKDLYPDVKTIVDYRRSAQVYGDVLEGNADVGLVAFPAKKTGLVIEDFRRDKLVLICHPDHPLAEHDKIALNALDGEKFISFEPDLPTRKVIDRLFIERNVQVERAKEFDNVETVKRAVEIGSGVSIVPLTNVSDEVDRGTLVAVELDGIEMWRPLGVIYRRHRAIAPAQKQFVTLLKETPWALDKTSLDSRSHE